MADVQYDATAIQQLANKLYRQADSTVALWTLFGILIGAGGGYLTGGRNPHLLAVVLGGVVVGLLLYAVGSSRAFLLRVQAQTALCQVEIERNTRRPG